ncbi:MAG: LacI family transcriptional regulator [Actinobacteria bacterium]|nr:LacI family transcriptional regulator [Actinomycetota bacterium]
MNLKEVARHAQVSVATASRVLSGSDYPVNDDMRRRVEASANELGYVPNAQAQGLLWGNPRAVGLVVGDVGDPYFSGMVEGLQALATELQYLVTVVNTRRSLRHELDAFRTLRAHRVGIAILAGSGLVRPEYPEAMTVALQAAKDAGEAVVTVGRHTLGVEVSTVEVDNVEAGRLLGRHLRDLGHADVGVLAGSMDLTSTVDRVKGLREVLGEGLVVREIEATRDGGWNAAGPLLVEHPGLTALVGTADQMAIGASAWLRADGRRVPDEISVAGCNDIWVSRDLVPSLTTVHLPLQEMGAAALRLGIAARDGQIGHEHLQVELVVRESTGPAAPSRQ